MSKKRNSDKGGDRAAVLVRVDQRVVDLLDDAAEQFGHSRSGMIAYWLTILADVHERGSLIELAAELQRDAREGNSPYDPEKMAALHEKRSKGGGR